MNEQWLDEIREKMALHTVNEPDGLWEAVQTQLPKRKKAVVPLWGKIVAVSVAASLAAAVLLLVDFSSQLHMAPVSQIAVTKGLQPEEKAHGNNSVFASNGSESGISSIGKSVSVVRRNLELRNDDKADLSVVSIVEEQKPVVEEKNESKATDIASEDSVAVRSNPDEYERFFANRSQLPPIEIGESGDSRITASVYASNMIASSHLQAGYGELVRGGTLPSSLAGNEVWEHSPITDVLLANYNQTPVTKKKHNLPVRFGVSVRYRINERWGIESGLFYSYLHSKLTSGSEINRFDMRQSLQYIGLPVSAMFTVWKNAQWEFYAIGGATMEKCVSGSSITDFYLNGEYQSSEHSNVMERRMQFSVNAAVGAQFNLSSRVGIYAEPGVSYYFDNNSGVETIYKDRPFNFSAKLGVRISFE